MNSHAEIPRSLQHPNLSSEDMIAVPTLASLKHPSLFQRCQLNLICLCPSRKTLVHSDADYQQDRLVVPKGEATRNILRFLSTEDNNKLSSGIDISVYDTSGKQYRLCFLKRSDGKCVITHRRPNGDHHWRDVCKENGLQPGGSIKLWTLRDSQTKELCFVIERERNAGEGH